MPDINDIHKFYESNISGYQRSDLLRCNKFFLQLMDIPTKKPIKMVLIHWEKFKTFISIDWLGSHEMGIKPLPKETITKIQNAKKMKDDSIIPFGKYKGEKLSNVPPDYLIWLYENQKCYGELRQYIEDNLPNMKQEIALKNKSK